VTPFQKLNACRAEFTLVLAGLEVLLEHNIWLNLVADRYPRGLEDRYVWRYHSMQPCISVITLGVDDLERAVRFYRDGLGLKTEGIVGTEFEHGAVAFFDLQAELKLALWPRTSLAYAAELPLGTLSATELSLGHNVAARDEVDVVMEQARRAGARIVTPAPETFWGGYAGYFEDPDQHLWEVVWNPQWLLPE